MGSPDYTGCRIFKSVEHYARDCPQAGQSRQEWARAVLQETVDFIREEVGVPEIEAAVNAVLGEVDFVQEEPRPGVPSSQ